MSAAIDVQKDPLHKLFKMMPQHFLTAAIHDLTSFWISFNWPSDPRNTIYTLHFCRFSLSQDMFAKLISLSEKSCVFCEKNCDALWCKIALLHYRFLKKLKLQRKILGTKKLLHFFCVCAIAFCAFLQRNIYGGRLINFLHTFCIFISIFHVTNDD